MRFKKIKIRNIRSYKHQEIVFPEGSLLLSGDVGSGKTTILMAIEYALFGLQPGQKGNSLLRNNQNIGEVSLELEVNGKDVLIERKLKRTPKGISNESASITIDGERNESSVTEVKSAIVSLLGYPPEFVKKNNILYRYTVHTAQEQMKQIILEDSETRVNILRHVFGIDKYKIIKQNLAILITNLKEQSKFLQGEISGLEKDRESIDARKNLLIDLERRKEEKKLEVQVKKENKKKAEFSVKDILTKIEEKKFLEKEVEKTNVMISAKKEHLFSLEREYSELKKLISENSSIFSQENYEKILREIFQKKEELEFLNSKNVDLSAKKSYLEREKSENLTKKDRVFKIEFCPTCLQNVPDTHKHNILNESDSKISSLKNELSSLEQEHVKIITNLSQTKSQITELEERRLSLEIIKSRQNHVERAKQKILELEKQKESLFGDQHLLAKHAEDLKQKILTLSPLEVQYKKREEEFQGSLYEERVAEIALAELEKEIEISHREIAHFEKLIAQKENSKIKLYKVTELVDWLNSKFAALLELMEIHVLIKLRKEFSALFRKWFTMLVADSSLDSQLDENFTPIILQGETEMDYSYLSGGERTAVALAYRLALNQTINSLLSKIRTKGIIILDEPTDGFSDTQITKVRDILEEINAEQLIIVSHEQKIESFVDNVIKITKENDISALEENTDQSERKT